jgi:hypothetical protein
MNIGGNYSCFYHKVIDHAHPFETTPEIAHEITTAEIMSPSDDIKLKKRTHLPKSSKNAHHSSVLLDNYIHQYALQWWLSIGLLAISSYLLLKLKRNSIRNESNFTVK